MEDDKPVVAMVNDDDDDDDSLNSATDDQDDIRPVVVVSDDDLDDLIADDTDGVTLVSDDQDDVLDDEKKAIREEDADDVPVGLANSDPGLVPDDWEAREIHRGVGDTEDEEDVEALGFSVEDGSSTDPKIDTFGDDQDK